MQVGFNVEITESDEAITIIIAKGGSTKLSASGKSQVVGSTLGNVKVGDIFVGVNAYRKA